MAKIDSRRRLVFEAKLHHKRKPRLFKNYNLIKEIHIISKLMTMRIQQLTKSSRAKVHNLDQEVTKNLDLVLRGPSPRKKLLEKFRVPIGVSDQCQGLIKHWHAVPKNGIESAVVETLAEHKKRSPKQKFSRSIMQADTLGLEAYRFKKVKIAEKWVEGWTPTHLEAAHKKMEDLGVPYDEYKPLSEKQTRILNSLPILSYDNLPETMTEEDWEDFENEHVPKNAKQTRITDFFKPRATMGHKPDYATSGDI